MSINNLFMSKLDNLYYRVPVQHSVCSGYKTASTYNVVYNVKTGKKDTLCTPKQAEETTAYDRKDFDQKKSEEERKAKADELNKVMAILSNPRDLKKILGNDEPTIIAFIKKYPNLSTILQPIYPDLIQKVNA